MKKQKMQIGALVKIELSDGRIAIAKILKEAHLVVYKKIVNGFDINNVDLQEIEQSGELLYAVIFNYIITKGIFEIISKSAVSNEELKKIPPRFRMQTAHPELCIILYGDDTDKKALPSECIGMSHLYIWEAPSFIELIEDHLAERPNQYEELKRKELEQGLALEKERGMKMPWEGWQFN